MINCHTTDKNLHLISDINVLLCAIQLMWGVKGQLRYICYEQYHFIGNPRTYKGESTTPPLRFFRNFEKMIYSIILKLSVAVYSSLA